MEPKDRDWAKEKATSTLAICEAISSFPITCQADADLVSEGLRQAHELEKQIKTRQEKILGPLREAEKQTRELFRPALRLLEATKAQAKAAIQAYLVAASQQNRLAMAAVTEAAQAGDQEAAQEAARELVPIAEIPGVIVGEKWTFRVVDPTLVPREFLMVDERKLARHVAGLKDDAPAPVPGVVFERAAKIAVKGLRHG